VSAVVLLVIRLLMAAALYLFIGWVIYTIWIDLNRKDTNPEQVGVPSVTLKFVDQQSEKIEYYTRPIIVIGREPTCDCIIYDKAISARQARLSFHHNQWWIEDLDSTNGTFINQDRVSQPTVIISEDQITCGGTVIMVQIGTPS
jgi:pSer/pThr/pTyr-binding forkhead associated (FHA) protein